MDEHLNKRFISFEGIDFSGKSTQIQLLKKYLESCNETVFVLREPGGTEISERIRNILLDKKHMNMEPRAEILLYSAARVQLTVEKIIPLLQKGVYVIADRFVDSTSAYQGYGRGLEQEAVDFVNQFATLGLLPALTVYIRISPEEAMRRRIDNGFDADRLESSGIEFFQKVCAGYEKVAQKWPDRFFKIDGTQVIEEIHRQIILRLKKV